MEEVFKQQLASSVEDINSMAQEVIAAPTQKNAFKLYRMLERAQSTVERLEYLSSIKAEANAKGGIE